MILWREVLKKWSEDAIEELNGGVEEGAIEELNVFKVVLPELDVDPIVVDIEVEACVMWCFIDSIVIYGGVVGFMGFMQEDIHISKAGEL